MNINNLKYIDPVREVGDKDQFRRHLLARIRATPQEQPETLLLDFPKILKLAAMIVVVGGMALFWSTNRIETTAPVNVTAIAPQGTASQASTYAGSTIVKSVEVKRCHDATFIMNGTSDTGTIVWIANIELDSELENCL
jgi:hypothetical protein